ALRWQPSRAALFQTPNSAAEGQRSLRSSQGAARGARASQRASITIASNSRRPTRRRHAEVPLWPGINLWAVPAGRAIDSAAASASAKEALVSRGLRVQADTGETLGAPISRAVLAQMPDGGATVQGAVFA